MAEDHIHFTIGRQAASLKQVSEAVKAFEKLLNVSSKQPATQQAAFLREFLHIHNVCIYNINYTIFFYTYILTVVLIIYYSYCCKKVYQILKSFLFCLCH